MSVAGGVELRNRVRDTNEVVLTKADVEHLRNGTSLSMNEAWRSAGAALGAKTGAHSSLRRFFLDGARKARSHIT